MQKNKCPCSWYYTTNHNENEDENNSHNNRCDINRHILDEDKNAVKKCSKYKVY